MSDGGHRHDELAIPEQISPEWARVARKVNNWGRWGPDDQLGTLNHIGPEQIAYAATMVRKGKAISCGVPYNAFGPQGAHGIRRNPIHLMTVDGGDEDMQRVPPEWRGPDEQMIAAQNELGPGRFTDDYIIMPLQSGTQWDALAHFYYGGKLYNGYPANSVTSLGATRASIEPVAAAGQISGRGILLDIARHRGLEQLAPNTIVYPDELDAVLAVQNTEVRDGDILVVRTGWYRKWMEGCDHEAWAWDSPGLSWQCAEWCYDRNIAAIAADNVAVEPLKPEIDGLWSAFHMLALRDMGMTFGEIWNLEALGDDCVDDKVYEFMLVAAALPISGGVGTPLNPVAFK